MLEVQSALIESINESTVNEFRMSRPTMEPQENHPIPTFNLQNQHEHKNNHQSLRFRQHLQTNLKNEQGEKHNEQSSDFSKKILYVGNLSPVVTEEDLYERFGFKTTSYLQKTCKAELSVCPKTGNSRCFAYVIMSYYVYKEIVKLNGVVFKSKPIKIEDAKIKPKTRLEQYKISGDSSNAIMQKQESYHQQHQSQYQQPAAQHLPFLQSPHQQNSLLKS